MIRYIRYVFNSQMKNLKYLILFALFSTTNLASAQYIFEEKFDGCDTDNFMLEADTTTAKMNSEQFLLDLRAYFGEELFSKLKGTLELQVIVDLEGNSCLLSLKNQTNVKTKKLNLKPWIDESLKWDKLKKKVGAIIVLQFNSGSVSLGRMGMKDDMNWHYLKDN